MQKKFLDEKNAQIPWITVEGKPLASLCILSFNRPTYLRQTIISLKECTRYPYELIVVEDGSYVTGNADFLWELYKAKTISCLILNPGMNQGVGSSVNKAFGVAHGKYLIKLDSDLAYTQDWLGRVVEIMETFPEIGCFGLFSYHYDPCRWQDKLIRYEERNGIKIQVVEDFVGSTMVFPRAVYEEFGDLIQGSYAHGADFMKKMEIKKGGKWLALPMPDQDLVKNYGFGLLNTSLVWKNQEVKVSKVPLIFPKDDIV